MTARNNRTTRAKSDPLSRQDIEEIVAAAVKQTFSAIGLHVVTDEQIDALRADFLYARAWRLAVQQGGSMGYKAVIVVLVSGALGALWLGIRSIMGHP